MNDFNNNWDFSQAYMPEIISILQANFTRIISIAQSTTEQDLNYATDLNMAISGGKIAVRVRRSSIGFRDLTIRATNKNHQTELEKLRHKDDVPSWYIYGWEHNGKLTDWLLIDIEAMKKSGIIYDDRPVRMNPDGYTGFVSYSIPELYKSNAIAEFKATSEVMVSEIRRAGLPLSQWGNLSYTFLDILVKCHIPDTNDATYAEVLRLLRQSHGNHDRYTIHFDPSPSHKVFASRGTMQYSTQLLHDVAKVVGYGNIAHWQRVVINKTLT